MIFFTSDLHLGHENCIRLCNRPFSSIEEMDETLIENWNHKVTGKDTVYILGDLIYRSQKPPEEYLRRLRGKKHLILGNHDREWIRSCQTERFFESVNNLLYVADGKRQYLGTLKIPALDLSVKVYQGTNSKTLAKGVGHFEETSIWNGNVALAAHNRGVNNYFGQIHTLEIGDKITLTTKLGTRTYKVTNVCKVSETDRSGLGASSENMLTLYTCVRNQRDARWCVTAMEA